MSTKGLIEENQINTSYTKRKYLTPKEIAAFVLVNFGQKNPCFLERTMIYCYYPDLRSLPNMRQGILK